MNLFLPDKDLLRHFLLNEEQINDLQFLSDKLKLHSEHFHVFLLGGTGSGKSTLLNCIANQPLASTGVQRPTTTELTLYGDLSNFEIPEGKIKCFSSKSEDPTIFHSIVLWDFPDLDSYQIDNHKWSYLFRNYADCILLVVHPEKTKQATLTSLLKEYPKIPYVLILTHKDQYAQNELETVIADLKLTYDQVISLDSISDADSSRACVGEYFESVKEVGLQEFKSQNLLELVDHCKSALNVVKTSLDNRSNETNALISETRELIAESSQVISPAVFQVFQEKIFTEIQSDLLNRLIDISALDGKIDGKEAYLISFLANTMGMNVRTVISHMVNNFGFNEKDLQDEIDRMNMQFNVPRGPLGKPPQKVAKRKVSSSNVIGYMRHSKLNKKD